VRTITEAERLPPLNTYDLKIEGTPEEQAKRSTAMRCIVAVMADPDVPFTHAGIAERLNLRPATVAEALSSPECMEMLKENCFKRTSLALNKGVAVVEKIMLQSEREETRLSAFRSLTTLYRTLTMCMENHDSAAGEDGVLKIINQLEMARPVKDAITEKVSEPDHSQSRPPDPGSPSQDGGDQGRGSPA
jgi:hypothetical protein